jgi:hypothetical protein
MMAIRAALGPFLCRFDAPISVLIGASFLSVLATHLPTGTRIGSSVGEPLQEKPGFRCSYPFGGWNTSVGVIIFYARLGL